MATNITFEYTAEGPDGRGSTVSSAVVSMNDVTVNTTPTAVGTWTTSTVTADKQRDIFLSPTDAATAGVPSGWYTKRDGTTFYRHQKRS